MYDSCSGTPWAAEGGYCESASASRWEEDLSHRRKWSGRTGPGPGTGRGPSSCSCNSAGRSISPAPGPLSGTSRGPGWAFPAPPMNSCLRQSGWSFTVRRSPISMRPRTSPTPPMSRAHATSRPSPNMPVCRWCMSAPPSSATGSRDAGSRANRPTRDSKRMGEELVAECVVPWTIARPSIVVGDRADGAISQFPGIPCPGRVFPEGRDSDHSGYANLDLRFRASGPGGAGPSPRSFASRRSERSTGSPPVPGRSRSCA